MSDTMPKIKAEIEARLKTLDAERDQLVRMLSLMGTMPINNGTSNNQPKLAEALQTILTKQTPVPLRHILKKLQDAGHVFKGQNPKMSVYSALSRHPELFQRTPKGWTLKQSSKNVSQKNVDA